MILFARFFILGPQIMPTFSILSLSPEGLSNHPELQGNYLAAPNFAYKPETGWDEAGLLDFARDLTINGSSFRNQPSEEIKNTIFRQVDGEQTDVDGEQTYEPSLLARVLISAIAGQFSEAPLSVLLAKQVLLASKPTYYDQQRLVHAGRKEKWVTVSQPEVHFLAPNTQNLGWEADSKHATKKIILTYYFAMVTDSDSVGPMAVKKGESQLSSISNEDHAEWVSASRDHQPLPFEIEPLVSIYATLQLTQGFTERTQPAVFMQYTHANFIIYFPELLIFRHVRGLNKTQPRTPRSADAGFIPSSVPMERPSLWSPAPRETADISGFYGNPQTSPYTFTALQLDIAGSYYQWDSVEAENAFGAVETVRRSMNTNLVPLIERPIVVEVGNAQGPLLLPDAAHDLQHKLVQLIAEKRCLDASLLQKKSLHDQWLLKLTDMQPQLAETEVLGDMKKFQIQSRAPDGAELSIDQCFAAYALLFYPPQGNQSFSSELGKYLKGRYVISSEYAQQRSLNELLTSIHVYELTQETPTVDRASKHRFYMVNENRLLTEPCGINLNDTEEDRLIGFSRLLFTIQYHCAKQHSKEVIIPILFNNENKDLVSTTLIHFTLSPEGRYLLPIVDPLIDQAAEPSDPKPLIYFKSPIQSSTGFFKIADSNAKVKLCENDLYEKINRLFNPHAAKAQFRRTAVTFTPKHFKSTTALLDILTRHLDNAPLESMLYSCQTIQTEVFPHLRCIGQLSHTELAVLHDIEEGLPVLHHEIYQGRPTRLIFQQLNGQIVALREGLLKQEAFLVSYREKIATCSQAVLTACDLTRQPPDIAYPLAVAAIERNSAIEIELAKLRAQNLEMEQQLVELTRQLIRFQDKSAASERVQTRSSLDEEPSEPRNPYVASL